MRRMSWRRAAIMGCAAALGVWALIAIVPGFAQDSAPMGPKDVAVILIEDVPGWVSEGVANPAQSVRGGADVQILAVLKDPREVPVDRFLYALTDRGEVIVHPLADKIRSRFPDGTGSAVAVYVRVQAEEYAGDDRSVSDPFYVDRLEYQDFNDWYKAPWDVIGVADSEDAELVLPCLEPMTIEEGERPFNAPDTGVSINPDEYLPPRPSYEVVNMAGTDLSQGDMEPGEVRDGWMLCLAPDIPTEEIRVVYPGNLFKDFGLGGKGRPYWARREELSTGAWTLFEDQVVVGWNGEVEADRDDESPVDNATDVYEGDVWVSVGQGLRYGTATSETAATPIAPSQPGISSDAMATLMAEAGYSTEEIEGTATAQAATSTALPLAPRIDVEDVFFVQIYFEGMEKQLDTWDHLAFKDQINIQICDDIEELECRNSFDRHIEARGEHVTRWTSTTASTETQDYAWIRMTEKREDSTFPDYRKWKVNLIPAIEENGKILTECEPGQCISSEADYSYSDGRPYDRDDGRYFNEETNVPVIPLGEAAQGFRVVRAWFVSGEVLRAYGLRISLQESDFNHPLDSKWLFIEVESTGDLGGSIILHKTDDGRNLNYTMAREVYYGTSAGYEVAGNTWDAVTRSAHHNVLLVGKVPLNWQMEELLLVQEEGPVWMLR